MLGAISNKWVDKQMGLYFYHRNREHSFLKEIRPEDYSEVIQSEGCDANHKLNDGCISVGCMSHMRRRFIEALEVEPVHARMKKGIFGRAEGTSRTKCEVQEDIDRSA